MLTATVTQLHRYIIERIDHDDGYFSYEVIDVEPGSYRILCRFDEECYGDITQINQALEDAKLVTRALNAWAGRHPESEQN